MANYSIIDTISPDNVGGYDRSGTYFNSSGDDITALGGTPSEIEFFAFNSAAIQAAINSMSYVSSVQLHFTTYTSDVISHTITVTGVEYDSLRAQAIEADQTDDAGFNDRPGEFARVFQYLQATTPAEYNGFSASIPISAYGQNDETAQTYNVQGYTQSYPGVGDVFFTASETSGGVSDVRNAYITVSGIQTSNNPVVSGTSADQAVSGVTPVKPFSTVILSDPGNPTAATDEIQISILVPVTGSNGQSTLESTDSAGKLSGAGLSASDGYGDYTLSYNSIANLQSELRALTFTPAKPSGTAPLHVTFELDVQSGAGGATDNQNTSVDITPACYCPGTLIATADGEVPIKELAIGQKVVTAFGEHRPIKWIGRRSYAGRFLAANPHVQPVRFLAGSLADGLPCRDLLVSPDHAMFLDGLLIPARCLVNGSTITHERGLERVDYYHVELDTHDVLLAEGAPSESFMDDDSRGMFHNAAEFTWMYPDAARPDGFCAPRVEQGVGLEAIRQRLAAVAAEIALAA